MPSSGNTPASTSCATSTCIRPTIATPVPAWPPPEAQEVPGEMSEARRERIREMKQRRWESKQPFTHAKPITSAVVRQLSEIPHVRSVNPEVYVWGAKARIDSQEI